MKNEALPYRAEFSNLREKILVYSEKSKWQEFLGESVQIPSPPRMLFEVIDNLQNKRITVFDAFYFSKTYMKKDARCPGWKTRPQKWYWSMQENLTTPTSDSEENYWGLFDRTAKPDYKKGKQMYADDPFGLLLSQLRKEGKIKIPEFCKHIPENSRFGLSAEELKQSVYPEITKFLGLTKNQVVIRSAKVEEFSLLGNRSYQYLGKTYCMEWFADQFAHQFSLFGGSSGYGSFSDVHCLKSNYRHDSIGWRPVITFTSSNKTSKLL